MLPQEFVAKWRSNTSTNEKQVYRQHFLDLCALVGHPLPAALDPENKFFTFEAGAAKQGLNLERQRRERCAGHQWL